MPATSQLDLLGAQRAAVALAADDLLARGRHASLPTKASSSRARSGVAVPSRWTCSSAFGIAAALTRRPRARRGSRVAARGRRRGRRRQRLGGAGRRRPRRGRGRSPAAGPAGRRARPGAATSVRPTAWSMASSSRRAAAAEVDDGEADGAHVDAGDDAGALGRASTVTGAAGRCSSGRSRRSAGPPSARDHAREALGRGARRAAPARGSAVEAAAGAAAARTAPRVTSSRRGSLAAPVRWSIDSRTSTRVAGGAAEHAVHVGEQRARSAGRCPRRRRRSPAPARGRASSSGMKAPEPTLTSITSASSPAASFLDRIEATISGIDSTVPVTSRMA